MEPEHFYIATTASRGEPVVFSDDERARHIYIAGKTGMGKSTLQYNLAMLDIFAGRGVAVIDPHGDLAEAVADSIPRWRINEICYLNVADTDQPVGFNPLANIPPDRRALAAAGMVSAFKHLWGDSWGPRLEHLLYHGLSALLDHRQATLIDLPRLYIDERFREATVRYVSDPITRRFWEQEFAGYDQRFRTEAVAPILNKAGQFATSPNVRAMNRAKHGHHITLEVRAATRKADAERRRAEAETERDKQRVKAAEWRAALKEDAKEEIKVPDRSPFDELLASTEKKMEEAKASGEDWTDLRDTLDALSNAK